MKQIIVSRKCAGVGKKGKVKMLMQGKRSFTGRYEFLSLGPIAGKLLSQAPGYIANDYLLCDTEKETRPDFNSSCLSVHAPEALCSLLFVSKTC